MKYFAMIDGGQTEPMEIEQLVELGLRPDTYVWCKGMADWQQAREVADICRHFRRRLHDRLHPVVEEAEVLPAVPENPEIGELKNYWQVRGEIINQHREETPDTPPSACPRWLLLLAFLCFFPLAIAAVLANRKSLEAWNARDNSEAHHAASRAKMLAGIAVCLGIMIGATLIRIL